MTTNLLQRIVAEHVEEEEYCTNLEHRFAQGFGDRGFLWAHSSQWSPVLLCAHIDKVKGCPGYDDRLGVAIAEALYIREQLACMVLLTDDEETGNSTVHRVPDEYWERCCFCLVLDRRGGFDVVTSYHGQPICSEAFAQAILRRARGRKACGGGLGSDAEVIAQHLPTVNLSVGYRDEHTPQETYNPAWHWDTYRLVRRCIEQRMGILEEAQCTSD